MLPPPGSWLDGVFQCKRSPVPVCALRYIAVIGRPRIAAPARTNRPAVYAGDAFHNSVTAGLRFALTAQSPEHERGAIGEAYPPVRVGGASAVHANGITA